MKILSHVAEGSTDKHHLMSEFEQKDGRARHTSRRLGSHLAASRETLGKYMDSLLTGSLQGCCDCCNYGICRDGWIGSLRHMKVKWVWGLPGRF